MFYRHIVGHIKVDIFVFCESVRECPLTFNTYQISKCTFYFIDVLESATIYMLNNIPIYHVTYTDPRFGILTVTTVWVCIIRTIFKLVFEIFLDTETNNDKFLAVMRKNLNTYWIQNNEGMGYIVMHISRGLRTYPHVSSQPGSGNGQNRTQSSHWVTLLPTADYISRIWHWDVLFVRHTIRKQVSSLSCRMYS